jgi:nitrogen fixation/metabolism regulation signal transduction histidine kinase
MVGIAILNKGFNLPQNQWSRLGTPYFTTKANGNGLGLALVNKIIEAHGGKLSLLPDAAQQQLTVQIFLPEGRPPKIKTADIA